MPGEAQRTRTRAKIFLNKLNIILAKHELHKEQGKDDPDIRLLYKIFEVGRRALPERQQQVLEYKYIRCYKNTETAQAIKYSRATVRRDKRRIKELYNELLADIDISILEEL